MNILQNENLIIESSSSGAELTRIFSKKHNRNILWDGNKKHWGRQSPILFPIVGKLLDNETIIEENLYNMTQHGFARDMDFEIINKSDTFISYSLKSNESTLKKYPYSFELLINYTLNDNSINIEWIVKNTDSKDIFFSIGGHPAFNIPFFEQNGFSKYHLEFKRRNDVEKINLNGSFTDDITFIGDLKNLQLNPELFKNDALIYTNIDEVSICNNDGSKYITLSMLDFPLVGIWTPYYSETNSTAPFLCIEPWYGLADSIHSNKIYKDKKFINKLGKGKIFTTSYSIDIH
ncbi:aldose 1-epimerase family protein [Clostridioides sp. ES-W-0016-02]|uniref:aldose 1-epimerase family protein n=1 Tax=Clostridioides sp. ES-W-0016-02 TaxID=2770788 RepID=UPI001D117F00|nr:aldose 1-epimerase family protein [Clostridioides sp. ES-W-0016-02]